MLGWLVERCTEEVAIFHFPHRRESILTSESVPYVCAVGTSCLYSTVMYSWFVYQVPNRSLLRPVYPRQR